MLLKNPRVLLEPESEGGGGGEGGETVTKVDTAVTAVEPEQTPPPNLKGQVFDISDEAEMDYKGHSDAHSDSISPEFAETVRAKEAAKQEKEKTKEVAKKEEPIVEEKEETQPKVESKPKLKAGIPERSTIPAKTTTTTTEARDYSIFPEEVREELKKTSNPSFNFIRDTYKKSKEIEAELARVKPELENIQKNGFPTNWIEHPDAWRLHPAAIQALGRVEKIELEESHWKEQMGLIKAGQQYTTITGYDHQGNPL